jgi:hypothetical protein
MKIGPVTLCAHAPTQRQFYSHVVEPRVLNRVQTKANIVHERCFWTVFLNDVSEQCWQTLGIQINTYFKNT